ncbi:RagB/SusD family nutrient uptake outer membrane protein [Marinilabiliaceae bacterium ANBcel2]|nr:RagB/SusD family nutrient uptake outer membrane protein [Marinilabiliaceae bacterium ANBcel2]
MNRILIILTVVFAFSACSDQLEQFPSSSLPLEEAVTTVPDLNNAVNGVYRTFIDQYSYPGDFGIYADGRGGDGQIIDAVNHFQPVARYQMHPNSGSAAGFYEIFAYAIARANDLLAHVDNIEVGEDEEEAFNDLIGQLYAVRAMAHFDMARIYAQLPGVASDLDAANSGIVIADERVEVDAQFRRSTLRETYDFIIEDFQKSLDYLSKEEADGSGKINYWAAKALLSRVFLYYEDYDNALTNAHDVIVDSPYSLFEIDEFISSWKQQGTSESLFEVLITSTMSAQRNSIGYYTNPDGYAEFAASDDFRDWLVAQSDDIRSQSIAFKSDEGSNEAYYTIKYEGREGVADPLYINNPKIIRLAEVYLIAAEAALLGGVSGEAYDAVDYYNELRANRIDEYAEVSDIDIDDILDERRRELFGENHRMFDLVRHQRSIIHPDIGEIPYDDHRIISAIPQRERDISPDLAQNPGYGGD